MNTQHLSFTAPLYVAPDFCIREIECGLVIAQSNTGESYDDPTVYDGF